MPVIDASAMIGWCFADEVPRNAGALLDRLVAGGLAAPSHWPLEIVNTLLVACRRRRISADDAVRFLELVESLGVAIDPETDSRAWLETYALADDEGLTAYDAAYLELAIRRGDSLVSKDADLLAAARRRKVQVLDLRTD